MHGVPRWTAEDLRRHLDGGDLDAVQVVDVRTPAEFQAGHVPGAISIPLDRLPFRMGELHPGRTALVLCRTEVRATAAASLLSLRGHEDVAVLEGGMEAWRGWTAGGAPLSALEWFPASGDLAALFARARSFEAGARIFYAEAARRVRGEAGRALAELSEDEVAHEAQIRALQARLAGGGDAADEFPDMLEGGAPLEEMLAWLPGRDARDVLELALALEVIAWDRYAALEREIRDEVARRLFRTLVEGERQHVARITALLEAGAG